MSATYEVPSGGEEEHVYCVPGPAVRSGNGAAKGDHSVNSTNKFVIVALCVHTVVIAGVVAVCTYLLQVPTTDVVAKKDQLPEENTTSAIIMGRLARAESEIVALQNALATAEETIVHLKVAGQNDQMPHENRTTETIQMIGRLATAESEIVALKNALANAESKITSNTRALSTTEETIVHLKETSPKPNVIFHVRDVSPQPTNNSAILFRTVVENVGDAYNTTSGCFTAPRGGAYWFSSQICTYTNRVIYPSLFIRGTLASRVYVRDSDRPDCGSVTAVATLEVGDIVCLKSGPDQSTDPVWSYVEYNANNFMGAIIN